MNLKDKGLIRGRLAVFVTGLLLGIMTWTSCGDVFRPIQQPIPQPPGDPKLFHFVLMISANAPGFPGSATQIDVSGDTNLGVAALGKGPVHAAAQLPSASRFFAANASDDSVSSFSVSTSGIGSPAVISLPIGSKPSFLHSTENATMYVILSGTGTVGVIATTQGVLTQQVTVGANPVAMAETPNGKKLYVVNQGSNTVSVIDTTDHTVRATIPVGTSPAAAAAGLDNSKVFVLNPGSHNISVISALTDTVVATASVGNGPNSLYYDSTLNRLYITNSADNTVTIFDVAGNTPTCVSGLATSPYCQLALPASASQPVGVTALTTGKHAYVLTYQIERNITEPTLDPNPNLYSVIHTQVVDVNTLTNSVAGTVALANFLYPPPPQVYSPPPQAVPLPCDGLSQASRFGIASAPDGSRVYVAQCDVGGTYIVRTADNTVLRPTCYPNQPLIPSPFSALPTMNPPPQECPPPPFVPPAQPPPLPPPQSPVFLLSGQ
jgi:YVTN family beta-propeller protein